MESRDQSQDGDGEGDGSVYERMSPRRERGRERGVGIERSREREREWIGKGGRRGAFVSITSEIKQRKSPGSAIPHDASYLEKEVAPAGSQKLWVHDPAPARRCGTEGKTGTRDGRKKTVTE